MHTHRLVAVLLATAALVVVPTVASAAALTAPVVRETFTPLPCRGAPSHRSTLQMEGCAEQRVLRSDRTIDALNRRVFAMLRTNSARAGFIASNSHWVAYRNAFCATAGAPFSGGSEQPVVVAQCLGTLDVEHVADLKTLLQDR